MKDGDDYIIKDSLVLPYNPIMSIKKTGDVIEVVTFYDDPYDREGFILPFRREKKECCAKPTKDNDLAMAKEYQSELIGEAFDNEFVNGYFRSDVLGIDVDYRRYDKKNDAQNVEYLIDFMKDNNIPSTTYKGYESQKATATIAQLEILLKEMKAHGVFLYNKKDQLRAQIKNATTIEEVKGVKW
jgi:hypothetical protein